MYSSSRRLLRAVAAGSASQRCARAPRFRVAREFSSAADASSAVASAAQPALPELDATAYQQDASDNASDNEELFEDPRQAILQAALKHVGREGCVIEGKTSMPACWLGDVPALFYTSGKVPCHFAITAGGLEKQLLPVHMMLGAYSVLSMHAIAGSLRMHGFLPRKLRRHQCHLAPWPCTCSYPSVSAGMFERGPIELVWHIMRKGNEHMSHSLEGMDMASMSVNERIKAGVKVRRDGRPCGDERPGTRLRLNQSRTVMLHGQITWQP